MDVIATGLPAVKAPFEWATTGGRTLYTAQIPIRADGTIETGPVELQAELILRNLEQTMRAAGGSLKDVVQVLVYLTDVADVAKMNEVYARFFLPPYPNRATMIISALAIPGMRMEVVAYGYLREGAAAPDPRAAG
jgi:enamine deaminase RidA (YjgF/YER057c/UK114 family)